MQQQESKPTTTAPKPQHQKWCRGGSWCDVRHDWSDASKCWFSFGHHGYVTKAWKSAYGRYLQVGLVAGASFDGGIEEEVDVHLVFPISEGDPGYLGDDMSREDVRWGAPDTRLEPEEARMLARWLLEAADECEKARKAR